MVADWIAAGARPGALGDLRAVDGARARRAPPAALDAHAARLARARADLQGADPRDREQGPGAPTASSATRCCRPSTSSSTAPTSCRWARIRRAISRSAREIARRFNGLYGEVFPEPKALFTPTPKVPGLDGRKMSKSYGNAINLSDPPDVVRKKCMRCSPTRSGCDATTRAARRSATSSSSTSCSRPLELRERVATRVPRRGHRLRRRQEAARRADHRLPGADPQRRRAELLRDRGTLLDVLPGGSRRPASARGETMELVRGAARHGLPTALLRAGARTESSVAASWRRRVARLLPESWRVHLPVFEGPLDLLLHLIKLNEVEITDIPVATICDQFHEYLRADGGARPRHRRRVHLRGGAAHPAQVEAAAAAAARRPRASPRRTRAQELVQRLLEYRRLKEAAQSLAEVDRVRLGIWTRRRRSRWQAAGGRGASRARRGLALRPAARLPRRARALRPRASRRPLQLPPRPISVRGQFDRLLGGARRRPALRPARTTCARRSCRAEAISAFLAVLELARLSLVRIHQTETRRHRCSTAPRASSTPRTWRAIGSDDRPRERDGSGARGGPVRRRRAGAARAAARRCSTRTSARRPTEALDAVLRALRRGDRRAASWSRRWRGGVRLVTRPELPSAACASSSTSPAATSCRWRRSRRSRSSPTASRSPAPEIQELRGVQLAGVLKTLLERRLVRIAGRKEVVGQAVPLRHDARVPDALRARQPAATCRRSRSSRRRWELNRRHRNRPRPNPRPIPSKWRAHES